MTPRKNSPTTIRDIARACGVSEATVSYVINGKRMLKAETRERIFTAMREMNYHPSAVARGLASKRVHTLGVLFGVVDPVEFASNTYICGLLQGVVAEAQRQGFNITFYTAVWQNAAISGPQLRDGRTDGTLVIAPPEPSDMVECLVSNGTPAVAISCAPRTGIPIVDVDNGTGARLATGHLLDLGHTKIAYLTGDADLYSWKPRMEGFQCSLDSAGVKANPDWIQVSRFDGSIAFDQALALLASPDRPTAIVCGNDAIALGVLRAAAELSIEVPGQLSVVGFDDIPAAARAHPALTTVRQPLHDIGALGTRLLIDSLREPQANEPQLTLLQPQLVVRQSTGTAPS